MSRDAPLVRVSSALRDDGILHLAQAKAEKARVHPSWIAGLAFDLPFPSKTFDRVLTTLVLHHLSTHNKQRALSEMCRAVRRRGELHIADWGKPHNGRCGLPRDR